MKDPNDTATIELFPGVTEIAPEDYKEHPKSVKEIRSDRSGKAYDWTPRDCLIAMLRQIDSGELKPTYLGISYAELDEDGKTTPGYSMSSPNPMVTAGLWEWAKKLSMGG